MKYPRFLAAALLAVAIALVAAGCAGVANPEGWASPAISEPSAAYIVLKKDKLYALDLQGDAAPPTRWVFPDKNRHPDQDKVDLRAIYTQPVVEGDTVYLADYEGGVFALDAADGSIRWQIQGDDISGNIVNDLGVSGDLLAFGTTDGHVYVVKKSDGKAAPGWEGGRGFGEGVWATPVIQGEHIFVATMGGELRALSLADGSDQWAKPFESSGAIASITLLDDSRLFVPSLNKHVYIVNTQDGATIGDFKASDWVWTEPAVKDNRVYFGDFAGNVYGLDITSGAEKLWEAALGQKVKSGPAIVENVRDLGDVLVVADNEPVVHFLRTDTGEQLNSVPLPDAGRARAGLTAADGAAYVVTTGGKLFAAEADRLAVVPIPVGGAQ